ncbi:peptidase M15 [Devosia beringensis]|uniref:peptidase M15 n=1 Tax=Devosia beringensis TaxID=2657486 RepID=UPI00186B6684|nr:peptidase M15 [Devosia beringensis]
MRQPKSVKGLEELGRVRLSASFYLRDFLYSEIAAIHGLPNIPDDPDLAIAAGMALCENLLEPLQARFGRLSIRSAFRSCAVNQFGNSHKLNCASNEANYAGHIWDRRDAEGQMGATACVVVNRFVPYYERTGNWEALAWWVHDHLPYSEMEFFPKLAAFNLTWSENPKRRISSYIPPRRGVLTRPGMENTTGRHDAAYAAMLVEIG